SLRWRRASLLAASSSADGSASSAVASSRNGGAACETHSKGAPRQAAAATVNAPSTSEILQRPSLAVLGVNILVQLRGVGHLLVHAVPFEPPAGRPQRQNA